MHLKLDVRSKILLLVVANIFMFMKFSLLEHFILATIFAGLIVIFANKTKGYRIYLIYLFFTVYEVIFAKILTIPILDNFLLLSSLMFKTIYLPICAGIILVASSKVSELITFLRKIKLPKNMIIVMAVIFRFFPVIIGDYRLIKNSLKMKGIGISRFYYLLHPWRFLEYVFVPYVIISTNTANELAISCMCRGIESNKKATTIQILKFKLIDYIFIIFMILLLIAVCLKKEILSLI